MGESGPCDPTGRFQRHKELLSARPGSVRYKGYDSDVGTEVTWHEIDIGSFSALRRKQIADDAELMKGLKHDAIFGFRHYWSSEDRFYCVTDALGQVTIADQMRRLISGGPFSAQMVLRRFKPVLQALAYLHERGVVHGGVTLSSIYLRVATGSVKLIPPLMLGWSNTLSPNSLRLRHTTSPERLAGEAQRSTSDIWEFGVSIVYAATGVEPYGEAITPLELMQKIQDGLAPDALRDVEDELLRDALRGCFGPATNRTTARDLLAHPFFHQEVLRNQQARPLGIDEIVAVVAGK